MNEIKLIIADDHELFRNGLAELLRKHDDIKIVKSVADGLELMELVNSQFEADIVLLDITMPNMDGFEVLKELKSSEEYKNIPVVIFSTSNDQKNIIRSKELGANLYITKPNSFAKFQKSIEHTLSINWEAFKPSLETFFYSC